jgi:hypothetical protein
MNQNEIAIVGRARDFNKYKNLKAQTSQIQMLTSCVGCQECIQYNIPWDESELTFSDKINL